MNKLFSEKLPTLQLAWDATSLYALSFCPTYYNLTVRQGYRSDTVDLDFGVMAHSAMERYDHARFEGRDHDTAQLEALRCVLDRSGSYHDSNGESEFSPRVWIPWGGQYLKMWRCSGTLPYAKKGKSGGKLKCPNAKAHVWWPTAAPTLCPDCGSPTHSEERWLPNHPEKNRHTLVRTVVWWCEELKDSPLKTLPLPNGKPMVEVNFQVSLPWVYVAASDLASGEFVHYEGDENPKTAERFVLCGYWDGAVSVGQERFLRERKTTKTTLNKGYWSGFSPNMQVDTYDLAVKFLPEIKDYGFRGVLVEAAQTLVTGSRFGYNLEYRTEDHRQEHLMEVEDLLRDAVRYAERDHWPMRKSQCRMCPMKKVCSMERGKREQFLQANYKVMRWNPLEER